MDLEAQVRQIVERTGQSPAEVRRMLMAQYNLTPEQYDRQNPSIRGTLPGGGFVGQPG